MFSPPRQTVYSNILDPSEDAGHWGMKFVRNPRLDSSRLKQGWPTKFVFQFGIIPLIDDKDGNCLTGLNPENEEALSTISKSAYRHYPWCLIPEKSYRVFFSQAIHMLNAPEKEALENYSVLDPHLESLLYNAAIQGSSDIYLENKCNGFFIRIRQEGRIWIQKEESENCGRQWIQQLLHAAGINESGLNRPLEGHLSLEIFNSKLEFRLSYLPLSRGSNLTMRVIQNNTNHKTLQEIGMSGETSSAVMDAIIKTPGLFLCVGPICSGKTTTSYAILEKLQKHNLQILGIEDPIERKLPGIIQCNPQSKSGWSFPEYLKAFLRHDPDLIFIGEIRDAATAELALRAALTGHRVLATLHAQGTENVESRLVSFGISRSRIKPCVSGILSQRLRPRSCPHCQGGADPGSFCSNCHSTGVLGLNAEFELTV